MSETTCRTLGCNETLKSDFLEYFCDICLTKNPRDRFSIPTDLGQRLAFNTEGDQLESGGKHNHYYKDVRGLETVDVYRVLDLFQVTNPCLQHVAKKALCAGMRGYKDFRRDLEDMQDSVERALEMLDEDEKRDESPYAIS